MPHLEEYRRTRRIVDLLLRIANHPRRWTRRALAELYEVSEKQMDKDILLLRHGLRMPLRHVAEGYFFERLTSLPALSLSLAEALSLLLAARLGQQMPGISRADLAAAIARVEALLPRELAPLVSALGRTGGEDPWERRRLAGRGADGDSTLLELELAIAQRSRLRMVYRTASHEGPAGERIVDPYILIPHHRSWYLAAHCHRRNEVRTFKVDRIEKLERTGDRFAFPGDFSLDSYMGQAWGILRGEAGDPEEVVLEFEPETARWIRDQHLHPTQHVEDLPDGRVRLSFQVPVTPDLRRWVLGFGRRVSVVTPASLAAWVREEARGMGEGKQGDQS